MEFVFKNVYSKYEKSTGVVVVPPAVELEEADELLVDELDPDAIPVLFPLRAPVPLPATAVLLLDKVELPALIFFECALTHFQYFCVRISLK